MSTSGEDAARYQDATQTQDSTETAQAFPEPAQQAQAITPADQGQALAVPAAQPSQAYAAAGVPQVQARNPVLYVLASFFVPGLGSMLNEKVGKGIAILASYVVSYLLMLIIIGFITAPAVWIWGMVAANNDAQEWNRTHGIIS